jgi:hypothetical protein
MKATELRSSVLCYAVAVLAAVFHAGQSIFLWNGIPGDLADARLVNCILEHVYQWFCGYNELFSPVQFYPIRGTLVYTDNHFGTALFYALYRTVGLSMESAFQGWLLTVFAANAAALSFLFLRQKISPWIGCPLVVFGTSSFALVYKTGHPQILPMFAFIVSLSFFLQFLRNADARALGWSVLWFGYQNACYFYHAYFTLIIFAALFALFACFQLRRDWARSVVASCKERWRFLLLSIAITSAVVVALYYPYMVFAKTAGTRPFEELVQLAPNPGAWFSASPYSAFYAHQNFYKPHANAYENSLFAGWLILGVLLLGAGFAVRRRHDRDIVFGCVLTGACLLVVVCVTSWGDPGSFYLKVAELVPSIRAFRSFPRIAYLLIILEAAAAALVLNALYRSSNATGPKVLAALFAFAIPLESLSLGQLHYLKSVSEARGAALVRAWQAAGNRPILVFAPGFTNQPGVFVNTDCWQAALRTHRHSVNGYSGNEPPTHTPFLRALTLEQATALLARFDIPHADVSMVTDWLSEDKDLLGVRAYHPPDNILPVTTIREIRCAPGETKSVPVVVESRASQVLDCSALNIFASYRIYDPSGAPVADPPSARVPVHTMHPGQSLPVTMPITAPAARGSYRVTLSMVHEGVAWWDDLGFTGSTLSLVVE